LCRIDEARLPEGDVRVRVDYSSLNYKDALAITGQAPVVRSFPMVPGIDLAGVVELSRNANFRPGDRVLLNGWGVGEQRWGGLAEKASVDGAWLMSLPLGMTARQAMIVGTAGYTAMLCIMALERHGLVPERGEVLVTGAGGGVGGFAIRLLSRLGYRVVAATVRMDQAPYLEGIGAAGIIDRHTLSEPGKPLQTERWAGVVDTLGSHALANACAATRYGGVVAACGLAQGMDFPATVAPFILRGVTLVGIDSVLRPIPDRIEAWQRLAGLLVADDFAAIGHEIGLDEVLAAAQALLDGQVRGRLAVRVGGGDA
jgi:acrylyl-CoA reductase (NADPH)